MKQKSNYIQLMVDCTMQNLTYKGWSKFMAKRGVEITWQAIRDRYQNKERRRLTLRMVVNLDPLPDRKQRHKTEPDQDLVAKVLKRRLVFSDLCMVQGYCACGLEKGFE